MYRELLELEARKTPLRVAVVGAGGAMGLGLGLQLGKVPGLRMVAAVDVDLERASRAAELQGRPWTLAASEQEVSRALRDGKTVVAADLFPILARGREAVDVVVEATNTIAFAARGVMAALRQGIHVVLMNAEVDCLLGPLLHRLAKASGARVTSDAGDQHGVLMRMIEEIQVWGFEIVMAGNIKGFLDRYATPTSIADEAKKRNLSPVMCASYTDGTKLNIEMALVANATGLVPTCRGMLGPRARHVSEVFEKFDLPSLRHPGVVDYVLGAEPGGGVFVVGHCNDPVQQGYLSYYKMGDGPFYLFYRPYHLCHIETPWAIASLAVLGKPILAPRGRPVADVAAFAKTDLAAGASVPIGIGGEHVYGMIERQEICAEQGAVPVCLLDREHGPVARVRRATRKDQLLTWDDLDLSGSALLDLYRDQQRMLSENPP
jgi:predicted homoserine dehydrogenase-like protein